MKMKTNTWMMLLIVVFVSVTVLAGCGSGGTGSGGDAGQQDSHAPEGASDKIAPAGTKFKVVFSEHPNQPVKNDTPVLDEIENLTNVRIEFEAVPNSNYSEKKQILLATNNLPDIIQIDRQDINAFASVGIFLPLMEYMEAGLMPNFKKHWDENPDLVNLMVDGELYGFPALGRNESKNGNGPVIRMDLLEKHNLDVPQTFDELLEVLAELKSIYPESNPWTIRNGTSQLLKTTSYMLGSGVGSGNGIYYDKDVDGGRYVFGPATEHFKEVLAYFNKAYEMGVLDPDYAVMTSQRWQEKMTTGQSFFFLDNSGFALNFTRDIRQSDPDAMLQVMPIPENSFGQRRAEYFATKFSGKTFAINAGVKDPETVVRFMDWLYSEEASNLTNFGVEGVHYEIDGNGEPRFKEEFVKQFEDGKPTPYYALFSELGLGKLGFVPWYSNTWIQFQVEQMTGNWDELNDEYWSIVEEDDAYTDPFIEPPLTQDEAARVKDILVTLNTMLEQEYDRFIMGVKSIDEYDQVIERARQMGSEEIEDIYNAALERALNQQ